MFTRAHMNATGCQAGINLCMRPANERRWYNVTSSLIGWAQTQNDSCVNCHTVVLIICCYLRTTRACCNGHFLSKILIKDTLQLAWGRDMGVEWGWMGMGVGWGRVVCRINLLALGTCNLKLLIFKLSWPFPVKKPPGECHNTLPMVSQNQNQDPNQNQNHQDVIW